MNLGITVEDGVDWGISLESGTEVQYVLNMHLNITVKISHSVDL